MIKKPLLLLFSLWSIAIAHAGSFSSTPAYPMPQWNALSIPVRMTIPKEATTVGEAVMYLLEPTGYKFIIGLPASQQAGDIALKPIPPEAFEAPIMRVADALLLLIGDENRLLVDPIHKLISFDKRPYLNRGDLYEAQTIAD